MLHPLSAAGVLSVVATAALLNAGEWPAGRSGLANTPPLGVVEIPAIRAATVATPAADREQTADQQVLHVLNRLAFGPRPGDVQRVRAMGVDRWISAQLAPDRLADPAGEALSLAYPALALDAEQLFDEFPPPRLLRAAARRPDSAPRSAADSAELGRAMMEARQGSAQLFAGLQSMRAARAVASERQLQEVMVDFWENHFNVYAAKGPFTRHFLVSYDRDAIRPHALGKFRDLLGAVAASPAMLSYLDNAQSRADSAAATLGSARARTGERRAAFHGRTMPRTDRAIGTRRPARRVPESADSVAQSVAPRLPVRARGLNENYARELLELHTLGVDGGYTQQDIIEVARALTGWTIERPGRGHGTFVFRPALHDAGAKKLLGVTLPAGRGAEDGEQVLDILARHPATARYIATKLARRFVSDDPPPALVARAAATFTRTNGDLREVVRTIVTSPEFFSTAAYRAKVKSPFELVVSAARAIGAPPDTTALTARAIARLGQPIFGHQAPNGWPETGAPWINTGSILQRINFGLSFANGELRHASPGGWPVARELAAATREQQVDAVVAALLGGAISTDTRQVLLSGNNPLLSASQAQPSRPDTTSGAADDSAVASPPRAAPQSGGLAQIVGLAIGSPEFQRR